MDSIFHEKQEGALCAQHCLNSLLQGSYFNAVDLATIARELDEEERRRMAEGNTNSIDYMNFLQEPSSNMDDSGYFSIQVICKALEVWNLEMMPYNSPAAEETRNNPYNETAYICNQQNHWLTIRKLGSQWFNLNSVKAHPELISDTYLSLLLAQLQAEGYSIFVIKGQLPDCEAQQLLKIIPLSMEDYKRYIDDQRAKNSNKKTDDAAGIGSGTSQIDTTPAVTANPDDVRNKRLKFFEKQTSSSDGGNAVGESSSRTSTPDDDSMTEDEMLRRAIEMSLQPVE